MSFIKFATFEDMFGYKVKKRIVNQKEIVNFIKHNPYMSENDIMYHIYGYDRNATFESNKKYADCLRRALYSGKIDRVKHNRLYVYFTPDYFV